MQVERVDALIRRLQQQSPSRQIASLGFAATVVSGGTILAMDGSTRVRAITYAAMVLVEARSIAVAKNVLAGH